MDFQKMIVFYEQGIPRIYDIAEGEDVSDFLRNIKRSHFFNAPIIGWAIIDIEKGEVTETKGLSDRMYEELDSLIGRKLKKKVKEVKGC